MKIRAAKSIEARRQADWIVRMEPWAALGYRSAALGRWLSRMVRSGRVLVDGDQGTVAGIIAVKPDFLLGDFIALLAIKPEAAGRGIGRALVERVARDTFRRHRWLYTSSDAGNTAAAKFYRKLGFKRVGKLPDLISKGRTEILWRLGRT